MRLPVNGSARRVRLSNGGATPYVCSLYVELEG